MHSGSGRASEIVTLARSRPRNVLESPFHWRKRRELREAGGFQCDKLLAELHETMPNVHGHRPFEELGELFYEVHYRGP